MLARSKSDIIVIIKHGACATRFRATVAVNFPLLQVTIVVIVAETETLSTVLVGVKFQLVGFVPN